MTTTKYAKYFCFLLIITQIVAVQLNVQEEIAINDEKSPTTNQLTMKQENQKQQQQQQKQKTIKQPEEELQQQQHQHQQQQHKSVDETSFLISDVSVSGVKQQSNKNKNYQSSSTTTSANSQHHESYDKIDDVVDDDNDNIDDAHINYVDNEENDNDFEEDNFNALSRRKRDLSDWLIAPNTRWCGRGNTADGKYNHLGGASLADKCCRRHDHCKHYITAMSTRYELFNYRPYTLSHCMCDRRFRTCLKMANDEDANTIGKLFFNVMQTQCFIFRTESICQKRAADGTCEKEVTKKKAYIRTNKKF